LRAGPLLLYDVQVPQPLRRRVAGYGSLLATGSSADPSPLLGRWIGHGLFPLHHGLFFTKALSDITPSLTKRLEANAVVEASVWLQRG
jgi:hypothetical protein